MATKFKNNERQKKSKKNKIGLYISIFIAVIMIFSVIGYMWGESESSTDLYNGFKFTKAQTGYVAKINKTAVQVYYHPAQLESIPVDARAIDSIRSAKMIYATYDVSSDYIFTQAGALSEFELSDILFKTKGIYIEQGISAKDTQSNITVITCADSTTSVPVIYMTRGNTTSITYLDGCIIGQAASPADFFAIRDLLIYYANGVMPNINSTKSK